MTIAPATAALLERFEDDLPTGSRAALEVLWLADDPDVGVADLGRVVMDDPGLTGRLMRIANSAYYGLSGRVNSATFAVSVLGFDTVRAIAATAAAGIDMTRRMPPDFLEDAAATAVGASLLAPRVGVPVAEAHSLGLLHNIGVWLLHHADARAYSELLTRAHRDGVPHHVLEQDCYGTTSGELGAALLETWRLPDPFVAAVGAQHLPPAEQKEPLAVVLCSAIALTDVVTGRIALEDQDAAALALCRAEEDTELLVERIAADAERLAEALAS